MTTKRTMIVLPASTHKRLKHLAVEQETSLTGLIRDAVEGLLADDRADIDRAESILKSFRPGLGLDYDTYRARRLGKATKPA